MTQDAFIDVITRLDRGRSEQDMPALQIAGDRGWYWVGPRLDKHIKWWNETFRTRADYLRYVLEDWTGTVIVIDMPTARHLNAASTFTIMLRQLGIRGVCLSSNLDYSAGVKAIAVFSDEDATLLSAHIST